MGEPSGLFARQNGGHDVHLLSEEIELIRECYRTGRQSGFVAALLGCSQRTVTKYFEKFRGEGLALYSEKELASGTN